MQTWQVTMDLPGSGLWIFMRGMTHGAELGHKEVVAAMVGRCVLFNVGELHELEGGWEDSRSTLFSSRSNKPGRLSLGYLKN